MSYPAIDDKVFPGELLQRKEFIGLKSAPDIRLDDTDGSRPATGDIDGIPEAELLRRQFRENAIEDPEIGGKYLKVHSQQIFTRNLMNPDTSYRCLHLKHDPGMGKCLDPDTPVVMYDGSIRAVRTLRPGSLLMGPDGGHRVVTSISRGTGRLFRITPWFHADDGTMVALNRDAFVCNDVHILTVTDSQRVWDVPLDEYLASGRRYMFVRAAASHLADTYDYIQARDLGPDECDPRLAGAHRPLTVSELTRRRRANAMGRTVTDDGAVVGHPDLYFDVTEVGVGDYCGFTLSGDRRFLLGSFIITHNTMAAVVSAQTFIRVYKKMYANLEATRTSSGRRNYVELDRNTPTVIVLGFGGTKAAFIRELLRHPEFGYISVSERDELIKRQKIAESGLVNDIKQYKELFASVKKRITNKSRNGFYKFYGYDVFVNRLFSSSSVKLTEVEADVMMRLRAGQQVSSEEVFEEYIRDGRVQVNKTMLKMFENSLLVCDEIHNTYNMNMKNNRGVAIQYVLDKVPSVRFLSLSATPINNSPTEIVELINYLVPPTDKITKRALFEGHRTLRPGALERIGALLRGRISFLQDANLKYFPRRVFAGTEMTIDHDVGDMRAGSIIPYLKFVACPMSQAHQATFMAFIESGATMEALEAPEPVVETPALALDEDLGDIEDSGTSAEAEIDEGFIDEARDHAPQENGEQATIGAAERRPPAKRVATAFKRQPRAAPRQPPIVAPSPPDSAGQNPTTKELVPSHTGRPFDDEADDVPVGVQRRVPTDGYAIYDLVFPDPAGGPGIFRSSEVRNKINASTQAWRDKHGVVVKKVNGTTIISGDFMRRDNQAKYSTKVVTMLDTVMSILHGSGGDPMRSKKIMIYHDRVRMNGVLYIQEVLRQNGFIDEYSEPVDSTLCICGQPLSSHVTKRAAKELAAQKAKQDNAEIVDAPAGSSGHAYHPVRFIIAHSGIDKTTMDQSMQKYNSPDNAHGTQYTIFIGSRIIEESYDFKDVQALIIMSLPVSVPTLIQVFGRCIRKNSHVNLPMDQRLVTIYVLLTTVNDRFPYKDTISPEVYRYIDKIADYQLIQLIEREINKGAIDADLHRDTIMSESVRAQYFLEGSRCLAPGTDGCEGEARPVLGNLYFEPTERIPTIHGKPPESTFLANRYYEEEILTIMFIIKRLFAYRPAWTYADLWAAVRYPPMGLEVNPALFAENNFVIALNNIVGAVTPILDATTAGRPEMTEGMLLERLFDPDEKYIYRGGAKYKVEQVDQYYILFPVVQQPVNPINAVYAEYTEHIRDKERAMIKRLAEPNDRVLMDVETYLRPSTRSRGRTIDISDYLRDTKANVNYVTVREAFVREYSSGERPIIDFLMLFSAQFQMMFTEEAIVAARQLTSASAASELYERVIELLAKFGVIVTLAEVRKYKDTAKQFKGGLPQDAPGDIPMGYVREKSVRLYDTESGWIEISRIALNRQITYRENEVVIGYFETAEDHMKFKLRKPVQQIRADLSREMAVRRASRTEIGSKSSRNLANDTRLIEKGIVCETKNKGELLRLISALGVPASSVHPQARIRGLCGLIRDKLIELEMRERSRDSRLRYLYSWWDETVTLAP